ncbi:hypothetical protein QFC22_005929 [Naganishia vaughanmartiniae]|uniref:Uncharacterized protein n=1 Tax=Naganishia vaughanmartiniae TaxID=1424756 RepID=A0ACC2WS38_9TREE|nr:hypothetical protein QFC22_005929 [Naganishia vaughanmartiniae]
MPTKSLNPDHPLSLLPVDASTECSHYSYPPVTNAKSQFPTIWEIASLVSGDSEAQAALELVQAKVNATVPDVRVKGTPNGDFCTTPKHPNLPTDIIDLPEPRSFGIGFDDGPNCSHNAFYEFLRENDQRATMFYIGSNVMDWPLQAQDAITDGHEICLHTWSHNYMTALTTEQAFAELWYTRKAITLVTGVTPLCWRPPFGDIDDRIRTIAQALNLTSILWQSDSDDWRINTGTPPVTSAQIDANYQNIINGVNNGTYNERGTIMLTHELNNFTMSEAIKWYPMLKAAFSKLVPIASAYNLTHPYAEGNISYPDFNGNSAAAASSSSTSGSASVTGPIATGSTKTGAVSVTSGSSTGSVKPVQTAAGATSAALRSTLTSMQVVGPAVGAVVGLSLLW